MNDDCEANDISRDTVDLKKKRLIVGGSHPLCVMYEAAYGRL